MFRKTETPSLSSSLVLFPFHPKSVLLSSMYILLSNSLGIRVGRSEATRHGFGTEAYRDRAGARKHHHVSVCVLLQKIWRTYEL